MLELYHSPMACSLAARLALAESGLPHEVRYVQVAKGENRTEAYLAINPSGKVPALRTPDGILTELVAILVYISDRAPEKQLLPKAGSFAHAVALSRLSYFSTTLHDAYRPVIRPKPGCDNETARKGAIAHLGAILSSANVMMSRRPHVLDVFSACDIFLFVMLTWRRAPMLAGLLAPCKELDRFEADMLERRGYADMLTQEMSMLFGGAAA